MKTFNKPYLKVVNLDQRESVSTTCVMECSCNIDTCTCNTVCDCVNVCTIQVEPSN